MVLQFSLRRAGCLCIVTVLIFGLAAVPMPSESQVEGDPFVTTWRTTTPGESITIPAAGTYTVDWGDGIADATVTGTQTHTYADAGTYTVTISGGLEQINLGADSANAAKLQSIEQWGDIKWTTMYATFQDASNMVYNADDSPNLSGVTDTSGMFSGATSFNGDISDWDTSSVTDMSGMFVQVYSFDSDISGWNVSGVTDMRGMFSEATSFNSDLSGWDTSSVTDMSDMFNEVSSFNSDLSGWDTSSVTDMSEMFMEATSFNSDLSDWDTLGVTNMRGMFADATSFNGDISGWDTSSVELMYAMFAEATSFNGDISGWDTSGVELMYAMFEGATSFNSDLSGWDTSSVIRMQRMFSEATSFNSDLSGWDTSSVTRMHVMFEGATSFNGNISGWDTSGVEAMSWMFLGADSFDSDISGWDTSGVIYTSGMFQNATSFNGDISDWDVSNVVLMYDMFNGATSFNGDISGWDVSSATSMEHTFTGADSFQQNLGKWYIVLDNASVKYDSTALHVATISPQNAWLMDNQDIVYSIDNTDDGDQFEIDGNALRFKSTPDGTQDSYALTILSSGDFGQSNSRAVVIAVTGIPPSTPLNIDAGDDQTVPEGATVTLNGIVIDAGSGTPTYSWSHNSSLAIRLDNHASLSTAFTAPEVDADTAITFTLTADDGTVTATDSLVVTVTDGPILNSPPVADAGRDQAVQEGRTVTLNGAATDPDDDGLTYTWSHDSTMEITFDTSLPAATFAAPPVDTDTTVTFTLTVTDGSATSTDAVLVTVKDMSGDPGFVTTWETAMPGESVTIPASGTYTIDWGDGTVEEGVRGSQTHTYDSAGIHTVRISGDIEEIRLDNHADAHKLMSIEQWGDSQWTSMYSAFRGASNMTYNADDMPDFSRVTDMGHMFDGASSFDGDISAWDVSNVNDMSHMFQDAPLFNSDISAWDVSNVNDMSEMFRQAHSFAGDLSRWDVSSVTDMYGMFTSARSFAGDVSRWDVSRVTDMADMFRSTSFFNSDISGWNIADTTRIDAMLFRADAFDQNLGLWYIVLDDDTISGSDAPGAVGSISTRNPYLDGQNPEYAIGPGGDSDYFEINGNVLSMLSVPDGDAGPYTVDITSTGDYGTNNSRTYEITVISSDIVAPNSAVEPEPDTAVDTQVKQEPDTVVDTQVKQEPDTVVDTQVKQEPDTAVDTQVKQEPDIVTDAPVEPEPGTAVDTPVEPEPGIVTDTPVEPEPGIVTDTPVEPEPGIVTDTPVEPESMPDPNQPLICGMGAELVNGTCELIQQDQDIFSTIKGWFESLFGAFF